MMRGAGWILVVIGGFLLIECGESSSSRSGTGTQNEGGTSTGGDSGGSLATGGVNATGGTTSTGGSTSGGSTNGGSTNGGGGSTSGGSTNGGGGSTSTGGAGDGGGSGDGGDECDGAMLMEPCATEGSFCGSCTNVCNFCNVLVCQSGQWARRETFPAPCFDCGNELRCQIGETFCRIEEGAAYVETCVPVPASCETNVTCACLGPLHPDYECSGETGSVTLVRSGG